MVSAAVLTNGARLGMDGT